MLLLKIFNRKLYIILAVIGGLAVFSASFFVFARYYGMNFAVAEDSIVTLTVYPDSAEFSSGYFTTKAIYDGWLRSGKSFSSEVKFNISSLPQNIQITDVKAYFWPKVCASGHYLSIYEMHNDLSTATSSELWTDARDGAIYLTDNHLFDLDNGCVITGYFGVVLNNSAISDLQNAVNNNTGYFRLGLSSSFVGYANAYGYDYSDKRPYLEISYRTSQTEPDPDPDPEQTPGAFHVDDQGNVGLGTDNPTEKFDLVGNMKILGNILSDGDICIGKCE